jgi:hypothetical protein
MTSHPTPPTLETRVHDGVALVEILRGAAAAHGDSPSLLVEVPHGADERGHYDALRARLVGDLPADLHEFFHVNTDIGAWQYGRRVAELLVAERPQLSAMVVRSLIPRTFIDCNRLEETQESLQAGGLTAGLAPYVEHPDDRALLVSLHRAYVRLIEDAYAEVCDGGGFALTPHTYGPYNLPIAHIDRGIVEALRACHRPEVIPTLSVRPEVDLLTRTKEGVRLAPEGIVHDLLAAFAAAGHRPTEGAAYSLQPSTQTWRFVTRYPEQVLCLEVRRDLLVETYTGLSAMVVREDAADRVARPLAAAIGRWLDRRASEAG